MYLCATYILKYFKHKQPTQVCTTYTHAVHIPAGFGLFLEEPALQAREVQGGGGGGGRARRLLLLRFTHGRSPTAAIRLEDLSVRCCLINKCKIVLLR